MAGQGKPKTGGRKKGTPNKNKKAFRELLECMFPGYDPVIQMAGIAQCSDVPLEIRIYCAVKVAEYIHPKKRAVDVTAELNNNLTGVIMEAYRERVVREL